ncbi:hypothetical protein [Bradyrhizobium canariense]|uniref:Uncharacterized protein n=1 Tax=Bradyrhizobium canariense TaxID=255045 RepID=A0A1H1YVQ1_9BRAD|nr:hypothetical protein [Bradyrhizobium canariense]SDT25551.1 hypothetical protein SAMN05444158_5046 [Bradyrhizobium canariense]
MIGIRTAAIWVALAGVFFLPASGTQAQTVPSGVRIAQASPPAETAAAPRRARRALRRVPIYPRREGQFEEGIDPYYYPGPNAVRDCVANYVQEYRPSGTVIVPRMHCVWRPG